MFPSQTVGAGFAFLHPSRAPSTTQQTGNTQINNHRALYTQFNGSRHGKVPYLPKPLDNCVVGGVAVLVLGVLSPVIYIDISKTTHEQLWRNRGVIVGLFSPFLNYSDRFQLKTHL